MTDIPAGWYPDPAPQTLPGRLRYWDGRQWTGHVHDPQQVVPRYPDPVAPQPYPPAYPQGYPGAYTAAPPVAVQQYEYAEPRTKPRPTTPDGQPLSGWWRRVGAQVLDGLILSPVVIGILALFLADRWDAIRAWFEESTRANNAGASPPPPPELFSPHSLTVFAMAATYLLVLAVYTLGFWYWKQATPGKLALGIRIRRREVPGPMPWGTMVIRFAFVEALAFAAYVPLVGLVFAIAGLVDYLWPLWDRKNQALHDKVAGTNVVLAPPHAVPPVTVADGSAITPTPEAGLPRRW